MKRQVMKRQAFFAIFAISVFLFTSCGSTYYYSENTVRYVEPQRAGFITPIVADMEISPNKIENTVEIPVELKKRDVAAIYAAESQGKESPIVLSWKKAALAITAKKYNADDIVSPVFEIYPSETKEKVLVIKVTGHPAVYKNYRKATKEDVELMRPFLEQDKKADMNANVILRRIN